MSTIENLNFKLIVNDKEFDSAIKKVKAQAKQFNTDVSKLLDLKIVIDQQSVKNATSQINQLAKILSKTKVSLKVPGITANSVKNQQTINTDMEKYISLVRMAADEYSKLNLQRAQGIAFSKQQLEQITAQVNELMGAKDTTGGAKQDTSIFGGTSVFSKMASYAMTYFSVNAVKNFVSQLVHVTMEFEKQRIALGAMIGDASAAQRIFEQIKDLAVESPFQVKELVTYAKQLAAYSVPAEELFNTTKMLADVSAGLGVDMERIILAYGQIRSASFLRGQEVRQLTEAGIPILQELSKQISEFEGRAVSVSEVFDRISTRQVTFEMVKKVFTDMTSEGGKFYNMQEIISQTLYGKISNLVDAWQVGLDKVGRQNNTVITWIVDALRMVADNADEVVRALSGMVLGLVAVGIKMINWGNIVTKLLTKTNAWFLAISVITFSISRIIEWAHANDALSKSLDIADKYILKFQTSVSAEDAKLRKLVETLNSAKKGTNEYEVAKNNLISAYDEHLDAIDRENLALGKTEALYDKIKNKIVETTKARMNDDAIAELASERGNAVSEYIEQIRDYQKTHAGSNEAYNQLLDYLENPDIELNEETKTLIETIRKERAEESAFYLKYIAKDISAALYQWKTPDIDGIIAGYRQANDAFNAGVDKLTANFYPKEEELDAMRKLVQTMTNPRKFLAWGANESWYEYIDRMRELYEKNASDIEAQQKLIEGATKAQTDTSEYQTILDNLKGDQKKIEEVFKYFNLSLGESKKSGSRISQKDEILEQIQEAQKMLSVLRKLRDASEQLKQRFPDWTQEQLSGALQKAFPLEFDSSITDYDKAITDLVKKIKALKDIPNISDSAKKALLDFGMGYEMDKWTEWLKEIDEGLRLKEQYQEGLAKFTPGEELSGTGTTYDAIKAAKDYADAIAKITAEYERLLKLAGEGTDITKLDEAFTGNKQIEFGKLVNKFDEIGRKSFAEWRKGFEGDMNTETNLFEKLKDSNELKKQINELANISVDELANAFNTGGTTGFDFIDELLTNGTKGLKGETKNNAVTNFLTGLKGAARESNKLESFTDKFFGNGLEGEDLLKWFNFASNGISLFTEKLNEYAKASNNRALQEGTDIVGKMTQVFQGFLQGGWVGAIIAGAKMTLETIVEEFSYAAKLEQAIKEANRQAQLYAWDLAMDTNTIFGENQVKQMREAVEVMGEITEKYKELYKTLGAQQVSTDVIQGLESYFTNFYLPGQNLFGGISDAKRQINAYYDAIAKGYSGIEAYIVKYNDRSGFANFIGFADEYANLKDLIEGLGYEMYDEYGNLNATALQAILDTYDRLGSADRMWMEEAIGYSEEYTEAMEKIEEVMEDVYGQYVGDIVDSMIDKWISLGTVTADYADALSDVAKNYAKMAIQSAILENVFTEDFEKQLREATVNMDAKKVMELFSQAQDQIEDMTPFIAEILEGLDQYFVSDSSSDSLSSGIKSITEETASLLASYVNAIRADVSVTRSNIGTMSTNLKTILGLLPSAPNLAEYLTQIQANTYNTQVATESILSELRAVIGTESGMTAVRVSM